MNIFKRYLATCFLVALGTIAPQAQAQTAAVAAYAVQDVSSRTGFFDATYTFKRSFAANDPTFPNKTDYVKRSLAIPKTGNPLNWVKNNALTLAVTGAVAAAGYVIDELTNQVMNPSASTPATSAEGWEANKRYSVYGNWLPYLTIENLQPIYDAKAVADYGAGAYAEINVVQPWSVVSGYMQVQGDWVYPNGARSYFDNVFAKQSCTTGQEACYDTAPDMAGEPEPVSDAEVWTLIEPALASNPSAIQGILTDNLGNPYYFQPVADAADSIGASVTGYTDYPGAIVTEPVGSAPEVAADTAPVDIELPTDYAREDTTQGVLDKVTELAQFFDTSAVQDYAPNDPNSEYWNSVFDPVEADMQAIADPVGDPTSLMPSLPQYSATCETLSYGMMGATFTFPTPSQCDKLNTGKTIIGWFLYVVTAGLIINLFLSRTGRAVT